MQGVWNFNGSIEKYHHISEYYQNLIMDTVREIKELCKFSTGWILKHLDSGVLMFKFII